MIDFPASPTVGAVFTSGGMSWTWDGTKWAAAIATGGAYVAKTGDTMSGPLILSGDPTQALGAVDKQYVDARPILGDNRIINGDMRIDQRNNGNNSAATGSTVDRWGYSATQANKGVWQRVGGAAPGFFYSLLFTSSSAYAVAAGDLFGFYQAIEADMVMDFAWGTVNAQPVTLSFWAESSLTGVFGGVVRNYANNRSYPFTYSLPTANTWTKIAITIPGDTGGTWVMSGNGGAIYVMFDLGSGATYRAPAGAWVNGNFSGANGGANVVSTNAANFVLTGVKLEVGSVATPYNRQPLSQSLADCQRYYEVGSGEIYEGYLTNGSNAYKATRFSVTKRIAPTITYSNQGFSGFPTNTPNPAQVGADMFFSYIAANITGRGFYQFAWTANAEL